MRPGERHDGRGDDGHETTMAVAGGAAFAPAERVLRDGEEVVLPVAEEVLRLGKREVETGRVRITLSTDTVPEVLRETLRHRRAEVERVPVRDGEFDAPPPTRQEGDTLVVPVVEEVVVVTRRYRVREELRLRLFVSEEAVELPAERRVQRATVERLPPGSPGAGRDAALPEAAE